MPANAHADSRPGPEPRRWGAGQRVDDPEQGSARILAAAKQCYAECGVAAATINKIAERAGVSRRTVYRYFDSKEAITLAVVEDQAEPFFAQMRASLHRLKAEDFRTALIHCVLFAIENGPKMEGHQLLLGKKNASATGDFYLNSARMRSTLHSLLDDLFQHDQVRGDIDSAWRLDDVLNWSGRLVYSFIQFPQSPDKVKRLVQQFLLYRPNDECAREMF